MKKKKERVRGESFFPSAKKGLQGLKGNRMGGTNTQFEEKMGEKLDEGFYQENDKKQNSTRKKKGKRETAKKTAGGKLRYTTNLFWGRGSGKSAGLIKEGGFGIRKGRDKGVGAN